jgi:predicted lipoprotein with Yx(FWY)xxD motif
VKRLSALPIVLLAALPAACGSSSSPARTSAPTGGGAGASALATKHLDGLGVVLVNGQGRTLYVFAPDNAKKVTCTGTCAQVWPPLKVPAGQKPSISGAVKSSLVASASNPSGGQVVTYAGWPLYTYVADATPGTAHGQALNNSGGVWYVISPSGQVIKKQGGAASSKGGSGY